MTTSTLDFPDGRRFAQIEVDDAAELHLLEPGLAELRLPAGSVDAMPVAIRLDLDGEVAWWTPSGAHGLGADWGSGAEVRSMSSAPVGALLGPDDDRAVLVVALSANVRRARLAAGVREEDGTFRVRVTAEDVATGTPDTDDTDDTDDTVTVRVDVRGLPLGDALDEVGAGWDTELAAANSPVSVVPAVGRVAMFSTWYAEHQHVTAESVERQAELGAAVGLAAVIVDDGWHTADTGRGYAYCGDWSPEPAAFPDMAAHVARVHESGLRYLLWLAPPLVGPHSKAWAGVADRLLGYSENLRAGVVDPRFPDVRAALVERLVRPVRDWGVDGLKIDFVDQWSRFGATPRDGTDCAGVDEAVERLLTDVLRGVRAIREDVLIEYRQPYVGPRLWSAGTLIRAGDCPADAVANRSSTLDLRLLAGSRAIHADMLMWHPDATAQAAAAQLTAVLYAVPQISVPLDTLADRHRDVLEFWLGVVARWRPVLQFGRLRTGGAAERFGWARADDERTTFLTTWADGLLRVDDGVAGELVIVNARAHDGVVVTGLPDGSSALVVHGCDGRVLLEDRVELGPGPVRIDVPAQGLSVLTRTDR